MHARNGSTHHGRRPGEGEAPVKHLHPALPQSGDLPRTTLTIANTKNSTIPMKKVIFAISTPAGR